MALADKQVLINKLKTKLSDVLIYSQMEQVIDILSETFDEYEIKSVPKNIDNKSSNDLLSTFLNAKTVEGKSERTIKRYKYCTGKLMKYTNVPIISTNVYHIRDFFLHEKNRGISDSTIKGFKDVFGSLFGWLYKEGFIKTNPCANIGSIKCEKKIRKPFTNIDIEKLKERCSNDRNLAIVLLLLSSGCRVSEVCKLNRNDIDLSNPEFIVRGKGNKQRTVYTDDVTLMILSRYLKSRTDDNEALFIGIRKNRFTDSGIRSMLHTLAKKAEVKKVHPHRFRRTLATNLIDRGMQIQEVANILGHESLNTTLKYVYISQENVRNNYKKYA